MRLGIKMPPRSGPPRRTTSGDCCEPNGPFLATSRSYSDHYFLVVAIHCLAEDDVVEWRNPGGLPEGTVIMNGGGITTEEHVILIRSSVDNSGLTIVIGATVNGIDIGELEITLP